MMIPTISVKGHHSVITAYATQGRQLHLISLAGVRESVRATLAALQHGHSGALKSDETTLVNFGYQSVKILQGRLLSGAFQAIAVGKTVTNGDILILKEKASLAKLFYHALLKKSTLPLHTSWQDKLLELAQETNLLTPISAHGVRAYALGSNLSTFETQVRHALIREELPEIGEPACV